MDLDEVLHRRLAEAQAKTLALVALIEQAVPGDGAAAGKAIAAAEDLRASLDAITTEAIEPLP